MPLMRSMLDHLPARLQRRGGLLAAAALYLIAWTLPSVRAWPVFFMEIVLRGPEATLVALGLHAEYRTVPSWELVPSVASALTNLVFVWAFAVGWRSSGAVFETLHKTAPRQVRRKLLRLRWILAACAALDTWWFWALLPDDWSILQAGYYAWIASFLLLAVAIGRDVPQRQRRPRRIPSHVSAPSYHSVAP